VEYLLLIDETLLKINGQDFWRLWLEFEPNLHVCLLLHLARERTIFVCYHFSNNSMKLTHRNDF
jgi:transposase-like protein